MKHFYLLLVATLAFLMGNASAQTQNLYVEDLEKDAQPIVISPGYLTMLEFYQEVDQVWGGQQGLLKIDASNSNTKLILTSTAKSGETDLIVEVGEHTLLFHITMTPGKKSRRYVVLLEKPASAAAPAAPIVSATPAAVKPTAPASKPPTGSTKPPAANTKPPAANKPAATATKPVAPVTPKPEPAPAPVLEVPAPVAVVPAPSAAVVETPAAKPATSTPKQVTTKPAGVPSEFANPKWLSFRIIGQPVVNSKGETLVPYSLRNNGSKSVTVDFEGITITQGDNKVECSVDGENGPISLKPGTVLTGRLRISLDPSMAGFNLTWSFLEEISNDPKTFVISRGVSMK